MYIHYPCKSFQKLIFVFAALCSLFNIQNTLYAQCPITVDAGPDQTACAPSGVATLQGSVNGNFLGVNWDPTIGLSDPTSLTPTVNVTGTETYTLTAAAFDPLAPNLVTNPAFELGNTGYTSQLVENPLPITPGTYVLTTSPSLVISNFPPCDDHTFMNGTGFMMLCNGPAVAGTQVWCQNIPVTPNTWYSMSAWATASPISPPQLQFSVNGQLLGTPYSVNTNPCNWQQFSTSWFSGPATSVDLCIVDQNGSGNGLLGDDFALDDIYLGEACTVSDDVTVSLVDVMAVLDPAVELPCNALPGGMMLDGSASTSGPNISYQWTTGDGNILSGANTATPTINMEGTYTLTVTYNDGISVCSDQASIQVLPDPNIVFAFIAPPDELNCLNPIITLDASASSFGPTISYNWSPAANILSGGNSQFPEVNMGGSYTLTVSNSISGCTATETVFVFENFNEPTINVLEPDELSCNDTTVTLSGNGSSTGNEYTYEWTTTSGNIVSGSTTLENAVVDSAGVYTLTVTNSQNGCTADTFANVMADVTPPDAIANAPTPIGCGGGSVSLSGTGSSSGSSFDYLWTTTNGNIVSGETTLDPTVDASAEYLLTVTNSDNGCTSSDTTFLSENVANLDVLIETADTLTCVLLSQNLDANGSTQNPDVTYQWTTSNGNLVSGATTLSPEIDEPGTYILTLTDGPTGCTASDSILIVENITPPTANAGPAMTIDCDAEPVSLSGSGSGSQVNWTTATGSILNGGTTFSPEVNAAGTYILTVTNPENGCTTVDSTSVSQVGDAPEVVLSVDEILNCETDTLTIDASGSSSGPLIQIEWTTSDGSFAGGQNTLTPEVDGAGTYTLTLTDQSSGCVGSGSIEVEIDTIAPVAILMAPNELTCDSLSVHLDGSSSTATGTFAVNWEYLGGTGGIIGGANTLTPEVNLMGEYQLTIIQWDNGCVATTTIEVTENTDPPLAEAGTAQTLTCDLTSLTLNGNGSSVGTEFEYLWTTSNGNIVSGDSTLSPTIDQPGDYLLTIENTENGCTATDEVTIDESADLPTAIVEPADSLTCINESVILSGTGSSTGVNFIYQWTTPNGNFTTGETTLNPEVDAPGTYILTVTDTTNNCVATEQVEVLQNGDLPSAEAGQAFTLSCLVPEEQLSGSGSMGAQFEYLWTTANGNIVMGETTFLPTINAAGTYTLTVTDTSNGCTATDEVTIDQDANAPVANAGLPDTLTCLIEELQLDGTTSSQGTDFDFEWTTSDGNFAAGQNTLNPQVDAPGTYLLTITNLVNNCQSIASVTIAELTDGPNIMVVDSATLNCLDTVLTLDAMADGQPTYLWTTSDGEILSGENTPSPSVGAAGEYLLVATDGITGCTTSTSVQVGEDVNLPTATIALPGNINCDISEVTLDGTSSSNGPDFSFEWTTSDGNFSAGQNTLTPLVDAGGDYVLTIADLQNGCSATAFSQVTVDTLAPAAIANAPSALSCSASTVEVNGNGSATGTDITYSWTTLDGNIISGFTDLTAVVDAPGTYILSVTNDLSGCTSTASVTVTTDGDTPNAVIAQPNDLNCIDSLAILDGSASTPGSGTDFLLIWETPNGNFTYGQTTFTPEVDEPGTYILIIVNLINDCADTATVVVNELIDPPGADAGSDTYISCDEPQLALNGSSPTLGVDYQWTTDTGNFLFGNNGTMPGIDASGTYVLTVSNPANGCTSTDEVIVGDSTISDFFFDQTDAGCLNAFGSITFGNVVGGLGSLQYSIDGGVTFTDQTSYDNLPPGTYELAVQDSGGCLLTESVLIQTADGVELSLEPSVNLDLGDGFQIVPSLSVPQDDIIEAIWTPADGLSCTDCLIPFATPTSDITYLLTVTDVNGCTASASISFSLATPNGAVYVPNVFSPNDDGINDQLTPLANESLVTQVERFLIFTRWGESVFENYNFPPNDFAQGWDGTHRGDELGTGVYVWFAEVILANGEKRFLKGEVNLIK